MARYLNASEVFQVLRAVDIEMVEVRVIASAVERFAADLSLANWTQAHVAEGEEEKVKSLCRLLWEMFYHALIGEDWHHLEEMVHGLIDGDAHGHGDVNATQPPSTHGEEGHGHGGHHGEDVNHIEALEEVNVTFSLLFQLSTLDVEEARQCVQDSKLSSAVAAAVAVEHAKAYFDGIVPALGKFKGCSRGLNLDYQLYDSRADTGSALEGVLQGALMSNDVVRDFSQGIENSKGHGARTIVIGPSKSQVAIPVSILMSVLDIPVISHAATSSELSNRRRFPIFARTIPEDSQIARGMCDYFQASAFEVVALLFVQDTYGVSFRDELVERCGKVGVTVQGVFYRVGDGESVAAALTSIRKKKLNVITAAILAEVRRSKLKGFDEVREEFLGIDLKVQLTCLSKSVVILGRRTLCNVVRPCELCSVCVN